jgi:hypothetical protein
MTIQLVTYLDTEFPLPTDGITETVQSLILFCNDLAVVGMYLLVVEMRLIRWRWVVAIWKEFISSGILGGIVLETNGLG